METIKLDLIPGKKMPSLHASQYDDGRDYHIDLTENRVPYTLDGTETISLTVRKCDNTLVTMDIANTFANKSYIEFRTTEQMNACAGFNYGEITIEKNGTQISSLNFYLQVEGAPDEGGITSQSEINNLARQVHDIVVEELADNGAEQTGYDNTESGLEATNVQDAIDEVNAKIENIPSVDAYTKEQSDEKYATKTELSAKADVSAIPTKTSDLNNDSGFAQVDDSEVSASKTYSSEKIEAELDTKASAEKIDNEFDEINDTLSVTTVKKESTNLLDINTLVRGTLSYNGTVTENLSADYWVTPFIAVKKNDYVHAIFGTTEGTIQRISQYNSNKGFISNVNSQTKYQISDDNVAFVRLQLYKSILNNVRSMVAVTETTDQPSFEWCYKPYLKTVGTRERIDIYAEDGIENFWLKMQEAFYKGDCDVFIHKGEYVYTNELIDKIRFLNRRGVPIGGGCLYYFDVGANVTCEYTGANVDDVAGYFSPLDSWNISGSWDFYNLTLVAKNVIYAFHDEADGEEEPFRHSLNRCYITLDNSAIGEQSRALSKCVGGGLGLHSEIYLNNCVFNTNNPNSEHGEDVSYHKANGRAYSDAIIVVDGCYFGGTFRCDMDYSPVPAIVPRVIACGNSALGINAYQCDARIWNNEIRT